MQRFLSVSLLASLCVLPVTLMAQENTETGSGVLREESGSGRTLTDVLQSIQSTLTSAKDLAQADIAIDENLLNDWRKEAAQMRQRQAQNRSDCAGAIRHANRDTLMEIATRCVRNDLLHETAFLQKQQEVLNATPLRNETVRPKVQEAMTAFTEASTAILNAIDAGLFSQMETLHQATRNLHAQYRRTLWQQHTLLRVERERTWMLHMQDRMVALLRADAAAETALLPAALCLEDAAVLLQSSVGLQAIRSKNSECRIWMQQAVSSDRTNVLPLQ